jgi:hypothetical protein
MDDGNSSYTTELEYLFIYLFLFIYLNLYISIGQVSILMDRPLISVQGRILKLYHYWGFNTLTLRIKLQPKS